jgi:hypothetical protein
MATATLTHPFNHIMPGPYSYAGYFDASTIAQQIEFLQDAPLKAGSRQEMMAYMVKPQEGACIGTCDHCNTAISYAVKIKGANGIFKVGETCATKINSYEPALALAAKKAGNERRTAARKAKVDADYKVCLERLQNDESLRAIAHPKGWEGKTLVDYLEWYRTNAGRAKFVEVFKQSVK